jgi:hypothetical protein
LSFSRHPLARRRVLPIVLAPLLVGCSAQRERAGADDDDDWAQFQCDDELIAAAPPLRRLSRTQHENTVRDLLSWSLGAEEGKAAFAAIEPVLEMVPADARRSIAGQLHGGFRRLDQDVAQEHINAAHAIARAIGAELTAPGRLETVVGSCATDADRSNDEDCVDAFIHRFGERALRRPLDKPELHFYRDVFVGDGVSPETYPQAFADVITVMLASPQFSYLVEHGASPVEGHEDVYWLSAYELAARLSYHFWQTMPDEELLEAARSGALSTEEGYAAQVDRLFEDRRTRDAVATFYREWLWLDDLPPMDALSGSPLYEAFAGDFIPTPETTENMIQEVVDLALHYTFVTDGTFADLFESRLSFARTQDLASIYGVPAWTEGSPPELTDPARGGLLTRAALLATGTTNTRPIMKGVFIRMALLCDVIPPPPDNANAMPPDLSPELTTREVVEALTEEPGTACAGCHSTLINPLGYATENFDALGRSRTQQVLFDADGNVTARRPVDTQVVPHVLGSDDTPAADGLELSTLIVDSGRAQACFARHWVRYSFSRDEDVQADGCMLQSMTTELTEGAPLARVLRSIAMQPEFRLRSFREEAS